MPDTCNHPAEIEREEDGRHVVVFTGFGWAATIDRALCRLGKGVTVTVGEAA